MTRAEHDQEYVLGTKQLLSAFFVVVALLGVFFTAGYIIGRNTTAKTGTSDASANASPATEAAQRTAFRGEPPPAAETPAPTPVSKPIENAATAPVADVPAKTPPAKEVAAKPLTEANPQATPELVNAVPSQVVPGHMYLQLMAVKRPVADNMVKLLKGRGYPALLGESSKPELFRVLVGPFTDMASLAKTKSGLKSAGFESVIAK